MSLDRAKAFPPEFYILTVIIEMNKKVLLVPSGFHVIFYHLKVGSYNNFSHSPGTGVSPPHGP